MDDEESRSSAVDKVFNLDEDSSEDEDSNENTEE